MLVIAMADTTTRQRTIAEKEKMSFDLMDRLWSLFITEYFADYC